MGIDFPFWIFAVEAGVLAGIILLWAVSHFRDELIRLGWLSSSSWIARKAASAEKAKIWGVLKEVGFREDHFQSIVRVLDIEQQKKRHDHEQPLSERLLIELKKWTEKLEDGFSYKASGQYYVDSMGAMSFAGTDTATLAALLDEWVSQLVKAQVIPSLDFVLAPKEGNVTLTRQFLTQYSTSGYQIGVVCKGAHDKSRVSRQHTRPHETDFEGLRALFSEDHGSQHPLNAISIDDNCTGGSSLCHAMRTFNQLVTAKGYPIKPVKHAVVLFAVKSDKTEQNFRNDGFELHAVLSLGRTEMEELLQRDNAILIPAIDQFKIGFGCESSRRLKV